MENSTTGNEIWFYELNGERKGGISETDLITLIRNGTLRHGSSVWKKGFADWTNIEDTQLREHLDNTTPPPLTGAKVNNTVVWILAFAPLLGLTLEYFVAYMVQHADHYSYVENQSFHEVEGFLLPKTRKSYRVDQDRNILYLRADYAYDDYTLGWSTAD